MADIAVAVQAESGVSAYWLRKGDLTLTDAALTIEIARDKTDAVFESSAGLAFEPFEVNGTLVATTDALFELLVAHMLREKGVSLLARESMEFHSQISTELLCSS